MDTKENQTTASKMVGDEPKADPAPKLANPAEPGGAADDGYIHLRLSPEGTQTGPERRKAGTSRGPNLTLPLKRLALRRDSPDDQVIRAVAGYLNEPITNFDDCQVLRTDNKMHAITVARPLPGADEPDLLETTRREYKSS